MYDFAGLSLWANFGLFAAAAGAVWWAGTLLERYADAIAVKTDLGKAFIGVLLLAAATSLPEAATVTAATLAGNTTLAVSNLLGSCVMNMVVLALADLVVGRRALSHESPRFALLMQGVGSIFLLAVALLGMEVAGRLADDESGTLSGIVVASWSLLLAIAYLLMLRVTYRSQKHPRWRPIAHDTAAGDQEDEAVDEPRPLSRLLWVFAGASAVVLLAGWLLAETGDAIAEQTGLGATFVGVTLLAFATSLPEISTTTAAARNGNYEAAFGNIFGSNAFNVVLLVLVAALAGGTATLQAMSASTRFAAALAILLTSIYLWGLLEREDRTVLRMGWDSAAVTVLAAVGFAVMYWLG